jgi:putative ABC transport system permease protein
VNREHGTPSSDNQDLLAAIQHHMLLQDLRLALRTLARRPAFTVMAMVTLALGLGANAAMFSVIHAVLLRPLPYPEPEAVVKIAGHDRATGETANLSPADFLDLASETTTLERAGAHGWIGFFTVADPSGAPERIGGVNVTEGFFPTLGASFVLGRPFVAEEDAPNAPMTVVLSHGFWQRRYGGDSSVIGRAITLSARPATIVGVLAASFRHVEANPEREADVYVPYGFATTNPNRGGHFIRAVGRLKAGATTEQAHAELVAIATRLEQQYPTENTNRGVEVAPLHQAMVAETRPALLLLAGAVGFVLLVACANLANLLLAQGASRRSELAVRAAMGASRTQLVRQLVTESVALSGLGVIAGLGLAVVSLRAAALLGAAGVPRAEEIRIDGMVLSFAALLALVTGVVSGLLPALQVSRGDLNAAVRDGGRGSVRPGLHRPLRELLIASQVALALVLLAGAGLMGRTLWSLLHVPTGFATDRALTFEVAVPTALYAEGEQIPFYERFYDSIRRLPGVSDVGAVNIMPLSANYDSRGVQIEKYPKPDGQGASIQARSINPDYFRAMGIPVIRGRNFTERDRDGQPNVVIVSQSMARQYWPGEDPIGQRITFNSGIPREEQQVIGGPGSREVVGIVGDVKHLGLDEAEIPMFYTPQAQQPSYHTMALVVRTTSDPAALAAVIRSELLRLDRGVPLYRVRTLDAMVQSTVAAPRLRAWLFGLFAIVALTLSAVGVYAVVGYLVGQRTQEIGIRLALGAARGDVLRGLVIEGLRPVVAGLAAGFVLALAGGRAVTRLLFDVQPNDLTTLAVTAGVLLTTALAATWLPARRALRVDPVVALRAD